MIYAMRVSKRVISHPYRDDIVQNGIDSDVLRVSLDSEWHGLGQCRAVFSNGQDNVTVLFEAAAEVDIEIPWEVLQREGRLFVTLVGYPGEGSRIVTRLMERPFKVAESGRITGDDPAPPTMTEIENILHAANEALKDARDAKAEADASAAAANEAAKSATDAAADANASASKADASAAKADGSSERADASASKADAASSSATASASKADAAAKSAAAAQTKNDLAQAKNNSDQAANNLSARENQPHWLGEGEYDPATLIPTIENPIEGPMYLVPDNKARAAGGNAYVEWIWRASKQTWEQVGVSEKQTTPISTDEIDSVFAGEHPTGESVLNLTGLSYVWAKVSAWATGAFAKLTHKHDAADISSGSVPIARGGTGAGTALGANYAILDGMPEGGEVTDADKVAMLHPSPTASTGRLVTKTAAQVWEWIKGKGDAVFAAKSHQHGAGDITSGTLPIARGGTGGATAEAARAALGASSQADTDALRESLSQSPLVGVKRFMMSTGKTEVTMKTNGGHKAAFIFSSGNGLPWLALVQLGSSGVAVQKMGDVAVSKTSATAFTLNANQWSHCLIIPLEGTVTTRDL